MVLIPAQNIFSKRTFSLENRKGWDTLICLFPGEIRNLCGDVEISYTPFSPLNLGQNRREAERIYQEAMGKEFLRGNAPEDLFNKFSGERS